MRRSPLKPKRDKPRRNDGRVQHQRIKEKSSRGPTAEEVRHRERIREIGCLVCGRPAETHHVIACGDWKEKRRDHRVLVPLCSEHHRGPTGAHGLSESGFAARYGIDLLAWGIGAWEKREALEDSFWTHHVTSLRAIAFAAMMRHKEGG
jgi:hypothetical protein